MTLTRALMEARVLIKDPTFINACVHMASAEGIVKVSDIFLDVGRSVSVLSLSVNKYLVQ